MAESLGDLRYGTMRLVESLGRETRHEFRPWMVGMAESLGSETRQEFRPWILGTPKVLATCATFACLDWAVGLAIIG
ncbi:hypothetical protein K227x_25860 [Rubripirellula lacrimiformis]|uniref:Uncharacterized protein n=1 Tax=Rubripirellula lacrimiformis TaxID=1930273 RepID=A0A517NAN4_9BACT|nr:hypothetical protein K227x_25860 [Rubripirellula lacrimiformis]